MPWYTNYLSVYEKPFSSIPSEIVGEIKEKIQQRNSDQPVASVVVIAHNEETRLLSCLWSLSENICKYPIEIIGVNNNSTDQTEEIYQKLGIFYYNEERKGPGFARQKGLEQAKGEYQLCIDADTLYPRSYIETHIDHLIKRNVACTFSLWSFFPDQNNSRIGLFFYERLRDIYLNFQYINRPELCVRGMTFGFRTEWAKEIGFRTDIKRGEDGSLALGLKEYGRIVFIRDTKARVITGSGTISADGSLFNSFKVRLKKGIKAVPGLFFRKKYYKDEESNLIKNS